MKAAVIKRINSKEVRHFGSDFQGQVIMVDTYEDANRIHTGLLEDCLRFPTEAFAPIVNDRYDFEHGKEQYGMLPFNGCIGSFARMFMAKYIDVIVRKFEELDFEVILEIDDVENTGERYERLTAKIGNETVSRWKYQYQHTNGQVFSTFSRTLERCREKKDNWLKSHE